MTCYKPNMQKSLGVDRAYAKRKCNVRVRFRSEE